MLAGAPVHGADYHLLKEIPVGATAGGDYLSVDESAHRLYVQPRNESGGHRYGKEQPSLAR